MHTRLTILLLILWSAFRLPCYSQPTNRTFVHVFGFPELSGFSPIGKLLEGNDGMLYGVTTDGGTDWEGVIYKVNKDGSGYKTLHHFFDSELGRNPMAGLIEGSDGALYGITRWNGPVGGGVVFRVPKDRDEYSVLHAFDYRSDSAYPEAGLLEGPDGSLYGTTGVTSSNGGSIFRLNKDGTGFATLKLFSLESVDGYLPRGEPALGSDGFLYGYCSAGGAQGYGVIYRVDRQGSDYRILKHLGPATGYYPSQLVAGSNNWLYGITTGGGVYGGGTLFKIQQDGNNFTVLHHSSGNAGYSGRSIVVLEQTGKIYATARGTNTPNELIFSINIDGSSFTALHQFSSSTNNGGNPQSMLLAQDGKLYVATRQGGFYGGGMLFSLHTNGAGFTNVWSFRERVSEDGRYPVALAEGPDGFLYTTTYEGGRGWGTLVRSKKDGSDHRVLHHFGTSTNDWYWYAGPFIVASNGVIYGYGDSGEHGEPARFYRINADGSNYSVIQLLEEKYTPGVSQGSDGILYGVMQESQLTGPYLFKLNRTNDAIEPIRYFSQLSGSNIPSPIPPFEGSDGKLYGAAYSPPNDAGVIYCVDKQGNNYSELWHFPSGSGMGANYLIQGRDRRFYGYTSARYSASTVSIFSVGRTGEDFRLVRTFTGVGGDGFTPVSGLVEGQDGALYGLLYRGNDYWYDRHIFRVDKDGGNFRLILTKVLIRDLISGSDGHLYGLSFSERGAGMGALFRIGAALQLEKTAKSTVVQITGMPGATYELQRSVDLANWSRVKTFIMPDNLLEIYEDQDLEQRSLFYRVAMPIPPEAVAKNN